MKNILIKTCGIIGFLTILCCVDGREFDEIEASCGTDISPNITFSDLDSLVQDDVIQIQEDLVLEGYVISSDRAGNFFGVLYLQDALSNPSKGLQLEVDVRESHLLFPAGSKVLVKLKTSIWEKKETLFE